MRRVLALGCCALHVAFGFVAGAAHVHESADHHDQSRGIHFDHAHPAETADHGRDRTHGAGGHDHHPARGSATGDAWNPDARHVAHHAGDAVYLAAAAARPFDVSQPSLPAVATVSATIDPPVSKRSHDDATSGPPRDPPAGTALRPRAPPA